MKTPVSLGVPFSSSRFVTIGSVSDAVDDDGIEQLFVETLPERGVALSLHGDHRLEGFQCLDRALEADRREVRTPCFVAAWAMIVRMRL